MGSVLKDHPDVLKQADQYPYIRNEFVDVIEIPEEFDGRDIWGTYMLIPATREGSSWALVAKDVLNDRFCLQSGGQMMVNFDDYEIISCMDTAPHKYIKDIPSYPKPPENVAEGYSIYDAWEFIYKHGACQVNCFSEQDLIDMKLQPPSKIKDYSTKIREYGPDCSNIEDVGRTSCLTKKNDKPIARRAFFCDSIYNIGGKDLETKVKRIKADILKWGPVAAGFIMYENFYKGLKDKKEWRGQTPYTKAEGKVIGGHYVSIVGYNKDYWICRNNWGSEWGLLGYFKIKIGIPECKLEDNVSACIPYLYKRTDIEKDVTGYLFDKPDEKVNIFNMELFNPKLIKYRKQLRINFILYYTEDTIDLIKSGKLYGSLRPLIEYPSLLPDMTQFYVADILDFDYIIVDQREKDKAGSKDRNWLYIISIFITCILILLFSYLSKKSKK